MSNINVRGIITAILIVVLFIQSCAFEFEPDIPAIDWGGGPTTELSETLSPMGGPFDVTCEGGQVSSTVGCHVPRVKR